MGGLVPLVPFHLCYLFLFFLAQTGKQNIGHLTGFSTSYWFELVHSRFTQLSDSSCNWLKVNALLKLLLLLHLDVLFCVTVRTSADCCSWRWRAMCFPEIWISRGFIFIVYFSFFLATKCFLPLPFPLIWVQCTYCIDFADKPGVLGECIAFF